MEAGTLSIRFYEELNDFLPRNQRKTRLVLPWRGRRSVKDLIESLGVPHGEIDLILINGASVSFETVVQEGDQISVYPQFEAFDIGELRRLPGRPLRHVRFIVDDNVSKLGRILRSFGFDTAHHRGLSDESIVAVAQSERRTILTRDKGLLKRRNVERGLYIRETEPTKQAKQVIERLQLRKLCAPFTRCLDCNDLLMRLTPAEAQACPQIPADVKAWSEDFFSCERCRKFFWKGSHQKSMEEMMQRMLGPEGVD